MAERRSPEKRIDAQFECVDDDCSSQSSLGDVDEVCESEVNKIPAALRLDDIVTKVQFQELDKRDLQSFQGSNAKHFIGYKSNTQNLSALG